MDFIRITALTDIGNNIAYSSLIPVVDMAGTPTTKKANLQIVANLVLSGAGGSYFAPAARAILAQSVTNAAQPNITSVGTLSSLTVSGNIGVGNVNATGTLFTSGVSATGTASLTTLNISTSANLGAVSNVTITGGSNGQVLTTNGTGGLSWTTVSGGSDYGNSNVASYLPTYTGNIGANTIRSTTASGSNLQIVANNAVFTFGQGGALYWPGGTNVWAIEPNIDDEFEIKSTSNVVISTDISNANSHFTFDTDGIFTAPSNVNLLGSRLNVGPDAATAGNLLNPTLVIANTGAQYIQAAIINNDGAGSSDWSADGAGGGDEEAWTDMGFAGFSFNDANYTITEPGDGYLFVQGYANGLGGNMVLATGDHSNTADIIFATGGFLANNEFARIDHANNMFHLTRANSGIKFDDGSIQTTAYTGGGSNTGNVTFDNVTVQGVNGLNLSAGADFTANLAYLQVRAGDVASHIHLDTGNNEAYDLIVGDDQNYVQVSSTGNILLSSYDSNTAQYTWTLDYNGNLILAGGNSVIQSVANSSLDPLNPNVSTMILTPDANYNSQALILDPTAPGHIHLRAPGANIDEPYANLFLGGELSSFEVGASYGSAPNVYVHSNNNTWTFGTDGNLTIPGSSGGFIKTISNASIGIAAVDNGTNNPAQIMSINAGTGNPTTIISAYASNATIQSNVSGTINTWAFGADGYLTLPTDSVIQGTGNLDIFSGTDGSGNGSPLYIYTSSGNVFGGDLFLDSGAGGTGDGGDIYITGGAGNANVGEGGRIYITGGGGNIGGDIDIVGGSSTQNPPDGGNVRIQSASYIWRFDNVGVATSPVLTYANLSAATIAGKRAFISDANLVAAGNFGNAVSGGGSNTVPVYSDGSVWRIG